MEPVVAIELALEVMQIFMLQRRRRCKEQPHGARIGVPSDEAGATRAYKGVPAWSALLHPQVDVPDRDVDLPARRAVRRDRYSISGRRLFNLTHQESSLHLVTEKGTSVPFPCGG
jgi:hypothetical protein